MKIINYIKKQWEKQDNAEKFFYKSGLVVILLSMIIGIFFPWIFDNALKWISETFSVPIIQERIFQLDAQGILFLTLVLIVLSLNGVYELVKLIVKKRKRSGRK